nr:hypothetical protein [Butyrivibrio sp.]
RADIIIEDAENHAQKIVRDAEAEADEIRSGAAAEGVIIEETHISDDDDNTVDGEITEVEWEESKDSATDKKQDNKFKGNKDKKKRKNR